MRTPERRTLTGCRWRMSDPRTARTRLRLVLGMPTRKTDFQTWLLTIPSVKPLTVIALPGSQLQLQKRIRIGPLPTFLVELYGLVDDDLSVRGIDENLGALQGTRGRSLEVHSRLVIAAAVARALELVLRRQPVRRAAEVRADGNEGVHRIFGAHDPDAELLFPALVDFADGVVVDEAGLELLDRLEENIGEHEASEDAGQAAESGGERNPGRRQDEGKLAPGNLSLLTNVRRGTSRERRLGSHLVRRNL